MLQRHVERSVTESKHIINIDPSTALRMTMGGLCATVKFSFAKCDKMARPYVTSLMDEKIVCIGQTEPQGYPKAYVYTPRGEVCSKQNGI